MFETSKKIRKMFVGKQISQLLHVTHSDDFNTKYSVTTCYMKQYNLQISKHEQTFICLEPNLINPKKNSTPQHIRGRKRNTSDSPEKVARIYTALGTATCSSRTQTHRRVCRQIYASIFCREHSSRAHHTLAEIQVHLLRFGELVIIMRRA